MRAPGLTSAVADGLITRADRASMSESLIAANLRPRVHDFLNAPLVVHGRWRAGLSSASLPADLKLLRRRSVMGRLDSGVSSLGATIRE